MARRSRPLQGADIFFVQANRGRNQSCHTLTIQRTHEIGQACVPGVPFHIGRFWPRTTVDFAEKVGDILETRSARTGSDDR